MRGQQQLVSVVILVVLILGAIALVLPWAFTMIQKKKDLKSVEDVYNFFQTLDDTVRTVANTGGEESLSLDVPGLFTVYPESSDSDLNNSIVFNFTSLVSNIAEGDSVPLNTPNMNDTGTLGVDSPSVIFGRASRVANTLELQYKLWYRTLNDTTRDHGYKIVLNTTGNTVKRTNTGFLRVQFLGKRDVTNALTITEINILV